MSKKKTRKKRTKRHNQPWTNPIQEPPLRSRMFWDLAKDACPCCEAGEFPFTGEDEGLMHPGEMPCLAWKIHKMFRAGLDPFKRKLVMKRLKVWTPMTLAAIIRRCDQEYWDQDGANLTLEDWEYDKVVKRLHVTAPDHPQLQVIGGGGRK